MSRVNGNDSDSEDLFFNPYEHEVIVISSDSEDDYPTFRLSDYNSSEIDEFHPEDDFFGAWAGEIMANAPPSPFPFAQPFDTPPAPANSPVQPLGRLRVRTYHTAFPDAQPTTPTGRARAFLNGEAPSARRAIDLSGDGPTTSTGAHTAAALAFLQPPPQLNAQPAMSSCTRRLCSREASQPMFDGGNLRHKPSVSVDNIFRGLTCGNVIPSFGRAANSTPGPIPSRPQNYDVGIPTPRFPFPPLLYSTPPPEWECSICLDGRLDLAIVLHTCVIYAATVTFTFDAFFQCMARTI